MLLLSRMAYLVQDTKTVMSVHLCDHIYRSRVCKSLKCNLVLTQMSHVPRQTPAQSQSSYS